MTIFFVIWLVSCSSFNISFGVHNAFNNACCIARNPVTHADTRLMDASK